MPVLPTKGSNNYRMCEFIYRSGGTVTNDELRAFFEQINSKYASHAPSRVAEYGYADRTDSLVILAPHVSRYFDGLVKLEKHKGEIVPPRHVDLMNRPAMQGYTAQLLAGKRDGIRDMSFHRTFASALPRQ